ncbi:MAG: DNA polymerase III subunit gamma/tau [Treponema sp.]|nr:DNA polymerase III subunit gamma/tau [Treponema sp.]
MSYEVTATRRRPQHFDDLVGQEFVAETLKNSIKSGKIAHAYLFSGPRGCGKTSTARILAKALNCANGPTDDPCGQCSNCQEITKGSSLDVIEIDGASNTSVENIRQIKDEVLFPPANCRYKIYIIDEVHMLSTSAFNALLKTIEEPPPHVIFIFATTELQKVPATIKSRCQQFNFRLVAIEKVKECLADAARELNIQADDEALFWIARESTGSMRDAYTLFDQVVAFSDGYITYEKIRDKLGLVGVERLNSIFEFCTNGDAQNVLTTLDEYLQNGVSIEQLISNCADYLRSVLFIKNGVTKESLLGNSAERYSKQVLSTWNAIQVERALSIFLQLYRDIRYSLSPRYELELAFSRLCWLKDYVSSMEVKKAIEAARSLLSGAPASAGQGQIQGQGTNPAQVQASSQNYAQTVPAQGSFGAASAQSQSSAQNPTQNQSPSQPPKPVPNGLPRLSMLDNPELMSDGPDESSDFVGSPDSEGSSDSQYASDNQGENQHPFYNGGSLPPEQSVSNGTNGTNQAANSTANDNSASSQPQNQMQGQDSLPDSRLKIHVPEQNIQNGEAVPTVFIPTSDAGYSLNPDDEDDWSNTAVPPDDDYYPVEENYEQQAEQFEQEMQGPSSPQAPAQLTEMFTTADGRQMSVGQLRGSVMASLSVIDEFAVTAVEKTGVWKINGDFVTTTVENELDLSIIKNKIPALSAEISKICGKTMAFTVDLEKKAPVQVQQKKELPEQVKILVDVFKGTVVAGA